MSFNTANTDDVVKSGQILCLTSGSYSDYSIVTFAVALVDFVPSEVQHDISHKYSVKDSVLVSWLESHGYIRELERSEMPIVLSLEIQSPGFEVFEI